MFDYMEMLAKRREFLEKQIKELEEKAKIYDEELADIKSAESTISSEIAIRKCKECDGTGMIIFKYSDESGTQTSSCERCGGKGYTVGEATDE